MRMWGGAVSAGHLVAGALSWMLVGTRPWFFAGCAVITLLVTLLAAPLMRRPPSDEDPGGGGGGTDPDPEPPWWPEFEREFRAHVERLDAPPPGAIASRT